MVKSGPHRRKRPESLKAERRWVNLRGHSMREEVGLPFEIRPANLVEISGDDPRVSVFSDDEWQRLLALARRHGFDPAEEYTDALIPGPEEEGVLGLAAAQELAIALSEALRRETSPGGEGEPGIRVGPPDEPGLQVDWARARSLGELSESGPVTVTRLPEP